jgi:hypothetical protein
VDDRQLDHGKGLNASDAKLEPERYQVNRSQALKLLSECTGDDIWSIEYCHKRQIPEDWINELQDAYESGFGSIDQTIFYRNEVVNQFEGIRDVDLACKIGDLLKVNVSRIVQQQISRVGVVREIREAIEEGDF